MNIIELAKQAGINSPDGFKLTVNHMATFQLEKFAELIIKECVGMLDDEDDYGPYIAGVRSAAYRIKKHFGV